MNKKLYAILGVIPISVFVILNIIDTTTIENKTKQNTKITSEIPLTEILVGGEWEPFIILEEGCKCSM